MFETVSNPMENPFKLERDHKTVLSFLNPSNFTFSIARSTNRKRKG